MRTWSLEIRAENGAYQGTNDYSLAKTEGVVQNTQNRKRFTEEYRITITTITNPQAGE
jgi:hypothetical protein